MEIHRVLRGELGEPNLSVLPQLPQRGPGADLLGRSATMLPELGFDLQPHGWRLGVPDGIDARRARALLASDENLLADVLGAEKSKASRIKLETAGPWSLVAGTYLSNGERVLGDHGARRDVIESYAHGVLEHAQRIAAANGLAEVFIQLAEPDLAAVLHGGIPTASGYRTLRSIPRAEVRQSYEQFLAVLTGSSLPVHPVLDLPAAASGWSAQVDLLVQAGVSSFVVDPAPLGHRGWERVAGLVESGAQIGLQVLDPAQPAPGVVEAVRTILRPWRQVGLGLEKLGQLTLLPAGSFLQASAAQTVSCLQSLSSYAQALEQTRVDA